MEVCVGGGGGEDYPEHSGWSFTNYWTLEIG